MANNLDEMNPVTMNEGREVNVIAKQIPVKLSAFENMIPALIYLLGLVLIVFGIIGGMNVEGWLYSLILVGILVMIYIYKKLKNTSAYFSGLEQKINGHASEIDNYMEQRVVILRNAADLIEKSVNLDKELFTGIAKYRSGNFSPEERQNLSSSLRDVERNINVALESYPQLQSQATIMDGMQQNNYLQREITAARSLYNDAVYQWNREIFIFPFNKIVAAREGKTTRIPFIASQEVKEEARGQFFK